ncbi:MAG: hypothetical protein DCC43_02905 [Candidatus Brocadia sp.]|nr:Phosphoglycolate phosphatase [Candidatus Brocadia fulgida]MCC6326546.1 HAD-IA family hydrolase [Candidatus Brocadia sp.]MCE7910446.1 HAD family hydrolase [Candidatus Brocadia sp. AMX3]MDG5995452.1 HAD family hydrolase [Candidatus Brocadia sp.]RIK02515.1 MAG: hypothetical protein DCC43_02905 [Candidatus Brocadia sp.]
MFRFLFSIADVMQNSLNVKALIFDLDDTLYDCSGTLVLQGRKHAAKMIARLIHCSEEEAYHLQMKMEEQYGTNANIYEKIVAMHYLPNACVNALWEEFIHIDIVGIALFPGVIETLKQLKAQGYKLILVTSGEKKIQNKKIHALGLKHNYFDDIFIADRINGQTKNANFKEIIQRYYLRPEEIVCIGDKIDDELTAGKSLGMITVMVEHGRHYRAYLKGQDKYSKPDYSIKQIKDILGITNAISLITR